MNRTDTPPSGSPDPRVEELLRTMTALFPHTPLRGQRQLMDALARFAVNRGPRDAFLLNGYAGTGKSTLMGAFVNALAQLGRKVVLMAPTGRAAKVLARFARLPASTMHRRLFRPLFSTSGQLTLAPAPNRATDTIFVVDEASMIADDDRPGASMLLWLARYVYSNPGNALVLMGDTAQLPPVGQTHSMAMNPERLRAIGLNPTCLTLSEPVRLAGLNGILHNATLLRRLITGDARGPLRIHESTYPDIHTVLGSDLEDYYSASISAVGHHQTIIITRSNWRAAMINRDVRTRILGMDTPLGSGENILITRNNYHWPRVNGLKSLLANGDTATVEWVGRSERAYGLEFADAEITVPGHTGPLGVKLLMSTLSADTASLSPAETADLYNRILADRADSHDTDGPTTPVESDPYFNALQIKHAYCITCHKAQGGQWRHVYIDMAAIATHLDDPDLHRWLYTAFTRASERLFLINPTIPTL